TVLDDTHPRLAPFQGGPHVLEHGRRNIRVAYEIVRCPQQFFASEATDLHEIIVAVGDLAFEVRGGNQPLMRRKSPLMLSDGLVIAHGARYPCGGSSRMGWSKKLTSFY